MFNLKNDFPWIQKNRSKFKTSLSEFYYWISNSQLKKMSKLNIKNLAHKYLLGEMPVFFSNYRCTGHFVRSSWYFALQYRPSVPFLNFSQKSCSLFTPIGTTFSRTNYLYNNLKKLCKKNPRHNQLRWGEGKKKKGKKKKRKTYLSARAMWKKRNCGGFRSSSVSTTVCQEETSPFGASCWTEPHVVSVRLKVGSTLIFKLHPWLGQSWRE